MEKIHSCGNYTCSKFVTEIMSIKNTTNVFTIAYLLKMVLLLISSCLLFAIFLVFLVFILIFYEWRSVTCRRKCRSLPSPKQTPVFGIGLEIASVKHEDLMNWMLRLWKEVGDVVYFQIMGLPNVVLFDPEDVEVVLNNSQHISKGKEYSFIAPWLCEGLLTSTGNKWHLRRKILTPTFHFKILENFIPIFNKNAQLLTRKLNDDSVINSACIDIDLYISLCTLDVICETAMGTSLDCQLGEAAEYVNAIRRAGEIIVIRNLTFWMFNNYVFNNSPTGKEFNKIIEHLHGFTENVIKERKESCMLTHKIQRKQSIGSYAGIYKQRKSFLDCLLEIQKEDPTIMTDADIREEVDTFMFEGHDTTSAALTWTLFMLATHPKVQDKVHEELIQVLGNVDREITLQDLHQMQYMEMVIKESLRLYPSVPYVSRGLTSDLQIKRYTIPAGANVSIIPYLIHRNPKIYPEPEKFDPDRFLSSTLKDRHSYAYIPFSAGYRNCIGQKFAMMESKVILSTILKKLRVHTLMKKEDVKVLPQMILRPSPKIYLSFTHV